MRLSSFETTILLTVDETIEALRKAEKVRYQAPGASRFAHMPRFA
jgi:hypothetical protein